jgi:hypothetical protein
MRFCTIRQPEAGQYLHRVHQHRRVPKFRHVRMLTPDAGNSEELWAKSCVTAPHIISASKADQRQNATQPPSFR